MARFLAIDIDTTGIFLVQGSVTGPKVTVEAAVADIDAIGELTTETAPRFAERIRTLVESPGVSAAPAIVSIGRDKVIWKQVKYPKTAPEMEPSVIRFQSQKELTVAPDSVVMDYLPAEPADPNSPIHNAAVFFVNKTHLELIARVCELAGLKLQGILPRPFASIAGLKRASETGGIAPFEPNAAVAVLSLWNKGGEFSVFRKNELVYSRTISPTAYATEPAMLGELKRSIAAYDMVPGATALQAVYVTETDVSGWTARLQMAYPSIPIHGIDPLSDVPNAAAISTSQRGRYLAPIGMLATRSTASLSVPNFSAPRKPKAQASQARRGAFVGALLLVALVAGVWTLGFMQKRKMQTEIDTLTEQHTDIKSKLAVHEVDAKRLAAVDAFRSRDLPWLDLYYDLNDQFPNLNKLRLKEFDGNVYFAPQAKGGTSTPVKGATPPTNTAGKPGYDPKNQLGTVKLVLVGEDPTLAEKLKDLLNKEPGYSNARVTVGGSVGSGKDKLQEYTIDVALFKREPASFVRKLSPPPPKPLPKDPDDDWDEEPIPTTPLPEKKDPGVGLVEPSKVDPKVETKETKKDSKPLIDPNPVVFPDESPEEGGME